MPRGFDPDTLYVVRQDDDSVQYVRTPDGIGAYWYDDRAEAEGDVSTPERVMHMDSDDFERFRERSEDALWS